jgi:hypothetical protein
LVNLQSEEPLIHTLRAALCKLIRDLYTRFLKPSAVYGKPVEEVQFTLLYNQKVDSELLIGTEARAMLADQKKHHLREERIKEFYAAVRKYFKATCAYLLEKLPLDDPVLKHAAVINPNETEKMKASTVDLAFFLSRFPVLIPDGETADSLLEQFTQYQITDVSSLIGTKDVKPKTPTPSLIGDRVDLTWRNISTQHPSLTGLSQVMRGIMTIPHSSSACERVFSTVRKNSTDQRASMLPETLEALLVVKAKPGHFLDDSRQYSDRELDQLKSAYYKSLQTTN